MSAGHTTAAVERYDIARDRWARARSMPVALNHAAIAVYRGDVYVVGGYEDPNRATGHLLRYDPGSNRWSRLEAMPTKRGALTAGVIGDRLYAAGGAADGKALTTLEVYDFKTRRWSPAPPMSVAREHLGGAVSRGSFHVLAGRAAGVGNMTIAERYLPRQRRWERLPDLHRARGGTTATALADGRIVIARRGGGRRHDQGGRALRPEPPRVERPARHADAAPRPRRRRARPPRLHDPGRPAARLSLLQRHRGADRPGTRLTRPDDHDRRRDDREQLQRRRATASRRTPAGTHSGCAAEVAVQRRAQTAQVIRHPPPARAAGTSGSCR